MVLVVFKIKSISHVNYNPTKYTPLKIYIFITKRSIKLMVNEKKYIGAQIDVGTTYFTFKHTQLIINYVINYVINY